MSYITSWVVQAINEVKILTYASPSYGVEMENKIAQVLYTKEARKKKIPKDGTFLRLCIQYFEASSLLKGGNKPRVRLYTGKSTK